MRMLFACRPTLGHLQPLLPLAAAAARRGHAVLFATGDPMVARAREAGFDCVAAGLSFEAGVAARIRASIPWAGLATAQIRGVAFGQWFPRLEAPPRLLDLDRVCATFRPDVVTHEVAELATPLAAATAGVPWVTVGFGPLLQPEVAAVAHAAMAPLWDARGLSSPPWAGLYKHLYVDPCPPALQLPAASDLPSIVGIRPDAAPAGEAVTATGASRRVYVTFGTLWNVGPAAVDLLRDTVAGCADAATGVVVTTGHDTDPALLGPLPGHVRAHRYVPQREVFPACAGVVSHGGGGTLLGTLAWGLPTLLLPYGADQFYNAERAVLAGVALSLLPAEVTRAAVADRVRRLLSEPGFSARAARVGAELRAMPDADAVLDRVEALVAATPP